MPTPALTPETISRVPPTCSRDQLKTATSILGSLEDRIHKLPNQLAEMLLDGNFSLDEWETFILAVRWLHRNEDMGALPDALAKWITESARLAIRVEDNGDEVPS